MKIIVAKVNRRDHLAALGQLGLQTASRPRCAVGDGDSHIGLVLAADAGEKLIKDMNDADHDLSPSIDGWFSATAVKSLRLQLARDAIVNQIFHF